MGAEGDANKRERRLADLLREAKGYLPVAEGNNWSDRQSCRCCGNVAPRGHLTHKPNCLWVRINSELQITTPTGNPVTSSRPYLGYNFIDDPLLDGNDEL